MRFLENAFRFFSKNKGLIIPLLIVNVVFSLLTFSAINPSKLVSLLQDDIMMGTGSYQAIRAMVWEDAYAMERMSRLLNIYSILLLLVLSATYGAINRVYSKGKINFSDFFIEMKNNILKFLSYILAVILCLIGVSIALFIVGIILGTIGSISSVAGVLFTMLFILIGVIAGIAIISIIIMGFTVVVIDKVGVFRGISTAISVVKSCFMTVMGSMLIMGVLFFITSLASQVIPVKTITPIFTAIIQSIYIFVLIVFTFEVYREKKEKDVQTIDDIPDASEYL